MSPAFAQNDDKRRVLDATDVSRLIGEHVHLRPKGREFVGLCPFHDDHSPSMFVNPSKGIYKCFSCGAGGDALSFMMNYHKMTFRESLEHLANRAGVTLTPWKPAGGMGGAGQGEGESGGEGVGRAGVLAANAAARDFFRAILWHSEHGAAARAMIEKRGVSAEMVEAFELGASPDRWDGLVLTARAKGLDFGALRAAGLFKSRESGGEYDAFRNRLMFPIHDQLGRVIAFGARKLKDEDEPKYLNSSESMVFDKGATLYGLHRAAQAVRRERVVLVTEGYMDALACHQAGFTNTVATLGTALTRKSAAVLRRLADTIVLLFDGDEAGEKAADRALQVFFAEPVDVRIAVLKCAANPHADAKDPDELLKREGGADALRAVIGAAVDAIDYRFDRLGAMVRGLALSARARAIEEDIRSLVTLGLGEVSPIRREHILKRIARVARVDETVVRAAVAASPRRAVSRGAPGGTDRAENAGTGTGGGKLIDESRPEETLLGCLLVDPTLAVAMEAGERAMLWSMPFRTGAMGAVASACAGAVSAGEEPSLRAVLGALTEPESTRTAVALHASAEERSGDSRDVLHRLWRDCFNQLKREHAAASTRGSEGDVFEQIARAKAMHAELGPNGKALPVPRGR